MALKTKVYIETVLQEERTVLKNSFCSSPLKIANVTEDKRQNELRLMLMSSSPGVLDNDEYRFDINIRSGSKLRLETQSYQRLFSMKSGASQNMLINLERGAEFIYLPHPTVPHENSIFKTCNKIYIGDNSSLLWGEVISCGRRLNDEVFKFTSYHSITEIFQADKLVVKENLLLRPNEMKLDAIGQLEGFTHQATLLYLNGQDKMDNLADALADEMASTGKISFGISSLPVNGIIVRVLGYKAEQLFSLLQQISQKIQCQRSVTLTQPVAYV